MTTGNWLLTPAVGTASWEPMLPPQPVSGWRQLLGGVGKRKKGKRKPRRAGPRPDPRSEVTPLLSPNSPSASHVRGRLGRRSGLCLLPPRDSPRRQGPFPATKPLRPACPAGWPCHPRSPSTSGPPAPQILHAARLLLSEVALTQHGRHGTVAGDKSYRKSRSAHAIFMSSHFKILSLCLSEKNLDKNQFIKKKRTTNIIADFNSSP